MKTIKTEEALFNWLFARLLRAEPIIDVTPGLRHVVETLHSEVQHYGYIVRESETCWYVTFEDLLSHVSEPGRARCSGKVIEWFARIYAAAIVDPEDRLSRQRVILITIRVLALGSRYLALEDDGSTLQIRSTVLCQRKFGVKICVDSQYPEHESDEGEMEHESDEEEI